MSAPLVFETYAGLDLDQLLAAIRERLADVADRLHLAPAPGDLDLDRAAALLGRYAEQQVPGYLADAHRQLGYAARDLSSAAGRKARGDAHSSGALARSALLYLDQAEEVRAAAELQHLDPLDRIAADLAEIRKHVVHTLAPALGWSAVPTGPYTLETAAKTVVYLREGYTLAETEAPQTAPRHSHTIRQHLANAGELLASAHHNNATSHPAPADEIADRVRFAAELVRTSAHLQQPTDQHGGTPA